MPKPEQNSPARPAKSRAPQAPSGTAPRGPRGASPSERGLSPNTKGRGRNEETRFHFREKHLKMFCLEAVGLAEEQGGAPRWARESSRPETRTLSERGFREATPGKTNPSNKQSKETRHATVNSRFPFVSFFSLMTTNPLVTTKSTV